MSVSELQEPAGGFNIFLQPDVLLFIFIEIHQIHSNENMILQSFQGVLVKQ